MKVNMTTIVSALVALAIWELFLRDAVVNFSVNRAAVG